MNEKYIKIYNLYKDDIYRLAFSYTKNATETEDIVQNVFIKLYKNIDKFEDTNHIKKWCIKVAVNECKKLFLSNWKNKIFPITEKEEKSIASKSSTENRNILDALIKLPKKQRIVVYLYYYEGYKINEISEILKRNESTIKSDLSRARETLKIHLM